MEPNSNPVPSQAPTSIPQPTEISAPPIPPEKPKKPTGLITATVVFAILAVAGIAGAAYFFMDANSKATSINELRAKLDQIEIETETNTSSENTTTNAETVSSVSVNEVKNLLKDKYKFSTTEVMMYDGWHRYTENFNQPTKILFTIYQTRDKFGPEYDLDGPTLKQDISFDDFNSAYIYYFGDDEPLEKKNYQLDSNANIPEIVYQPEKDSFSVTFPAGIGGTTSVMKINKVINVLNTQDGFKATIASAIIDAAGSSENNSIEDMAESLSVYEFYFTDEDGEYILTSIKKL